jgi:hypothetical protein
MPNAAEPLSRLRSNTFIGRLQFAAMTRSAWECSVSGSIRATTPATAGPVGLPRKLLGTTTTRGLLRMRLTLQVDGSVRT